MAKIRIKGMGLAYMDELKKTEVLDAFCELIDNAIDASASEIRMEYGQNRYGEAYIVVEDNGVGMSKDTLVKVGSDYKCHISLGENTIGIRGMGMKNALIRLANKITTWATPGVFSWLRRQVTVVVRDLIGSSPGRRASSRISTWTVGLSERMPLLSRWDMVPVSSCPTVSLSPSVYGTRLSISLPRRMPSVSMTVSVSLSVQTAVRISTL